MHHMRTCACSSQPCACRVLDLTPRVRTANPAVDARHVFRSLMQGLADQKRAREGYYQAHYDQMVKVGLASLVWEGR